MRAFARHYVHAGMVGLDGEKMSKSLGNLVFVSSLLADGTDPMAIRLAILAHHYRDDWDWTAAGLAAAEERLARWRAAVGRPLASAPEPVSALDPVSPPVRPCRSRYRRRGVPAWRPGPGVPARHAGGGGGRAGRRARADGRRPGRARAPSPRSTAGRTRSSARRSCRRMRARRPCSSGTPRTPSWASASEGHPGEPLSDSRHPVRPSLKAGQLPRSATARGWLSSAVRAVSKLSSQLIS